MDNSLGFFFQDPNIEPVVPGPMSVLYLLRRDIRHCIDNKIVLFPATMALFAGIDLLAKFYAGNDDMGMAGKRFKAFVSAYFSGLSSDDTETLYQLRNSLVHSFGLYTKSRHKEYSFNVGPASRLIYNAGNNIYFINPWILRVQFEEAIERYNSDIQSNTTLQANFQIMFPFYGTITVGEVSIA